MTAKEWLGVIMKAKDVNPAMEKLIIKYGEMLIAELLKPEEVLMEENILYKHQPCGCQVCVCEDEVQCQGCGAHKCEGWGTDKCVFTKGNELKQLKFVNKTPIKPEVWTDEELFDMHKHIWIDAQLPEELQFHWFKINLEQYKKDKAK